MAFSLLYTKELLSRLKICPNKKLGQNFLVEPAFVEMSISWAQIKAEDIVIEVGPGCGTLTDSLLQARAQVFAVEKDPVLAQHIARTFPINILKGDALEYPVGNFSLDKSYKVVANLPYAVASVWLDKILELPRLPQNMVLLVQKEAAERWFSAAGSKHFCALGINLQAAYTINNKRDVAKRCFYPQPNVDSVLISLKKKTDALIFKKDFKIFLRDIFIHRRQQIGRICRGSQSSLANRFLDYLIKKGYTQNVRAEDIDLPLWINFVRDTNTFVTSSVTK